MRPRYVLGSGLSHDGSSALLADGEIVFAIEKERLTRRKHDGFNDMATLTYCLEAAGLGWRDITLFVENNTTNRHEEIDQRLRRGRDIPEYVPRANISHHLAHAWSAAVPSGFEEATVAVMDGRGSSRDNCTESEFLLPEQTAAELTQADPANWWEKESVYHWLDGTLRPVLKDFSRINREQAIRHPMSPPSIENGIAEFYGGVTQYVFGDDFAQGKLMGLAPYGTVGRFSCEALRFANGRIEVNAEEFDTFPTSRAAQHRNGSLYDDFQYYADIARWAQDLCHKVTMQLLTHYAELSPGCNLAFAGGLALNAVINGRILDETPFEQLFVQPAANDAGVALGCAYYGWCEVLGNPPAPIGSYTSCFGRPYTHEAAVKALSAPDLISRPVVLDDVVELLDQGMVVAWFEGGCEFGPRALGRRSLLADPRSAGMRDHINRKVKHREDFRPFAPIVRVEDCARIFEVVDISPFMIMVGSVRPDWREALPAITHVDGSARIQCVSDTSHPRLHKLLGAWSGRSGVPVLINTSLNDQSMPIVETPDEAVTLFRRTMIDALVLENKLIERSLES